MRRTKNQQPRRCALWPETVNAIGMYCSDHRQSRVVGGKTGETCDTLLTRCDGRSFASNQIIDRLFKDLLKICKIEAPGVGLGSLRHTFATIADQWPDQGIIDLVMGHRPASLRRSTYRQMLMDEDARLQELSEYTRGWLFHGITARMQPEPMYQNGAPDRPDPKHTGQAGTGGIFSGAKRAAAEVSRVTQEVK
jgi:integrase